MPSKASTEPSSYIQGINYYNYYFLLILFLKIVKLLIINFNLLYLIF